MMYPYKNKKYLSFLYNYINENQRWTELKKQVRPRVECRGKE